ncbi:MAG: hypothetical protein ABEJ59_02030 [Halanaeroarchaeum sp.]
MSRGISTVVDVSLAVVLVGASVGVLAGVAPTQPSPPPRPGSGGAAVAGTTLAVDYDRADGASASVTATVAGHLRDAAIARNRSTDGRYVAAVTGAVGDRLDRVGVDAQLLASCPGDDPVVAGRAPPTGGAVTATVYRWNASAEERCAPVVVVRRWSP